MINDKGILIRNIYYMLSYAFQELRRNNYDEISKEDFEYIQDLFAEILYKGISYQLKQGLYREYIEGHDTLSVLRGKLDMPETIKNRVRRKQVLSCEFDELSEDNIFNQIIKTTVGILIRERRVSSKRKNQLKSILPFFDGVTILNPFNIHWSMLRFQRNNQTYKMLMNICYFILDGMLMTTDSGSYKMATFSEKHMDTLFEKFVLEYYRQHHKSLSANADRVRWNITDEESSMIEFLPAMKTDITLHCGPRTLVIDTKYYTSMMQEQFGKQSIHSGHLYQVFAYVKNLDSSGTGNVTGMILYAQAQSDVLPALDVHLGKNRFLVKTLDLSVEFDSIRKQLDSFIQYLH